MTMQYDVKSTHLNASGSVFAGRARIKGFSICATASQAGTLLLKDGGSGGTTDRKSTRLNSSHSQQSRMPSSA